MTEDARRKVGTAGLALSGALCLGSLALAAREPVAFQKVGALTDAPLPPFEPAHTSDVIPLIRAMPDRGHEGSLATVYEVLPSRKRQRTLVEGWGNCSNLVFGLAIELDRRGDEYEIVHLMPLGQFLEGAGHTVLRAKVLLPEGPRIALVGVAGAMIPRSGDRPIDVADLGHGDIPDFRFDQIRPESEDWRPFYEAGFQREVLIGRISSRDLSRYFRFLEAVYVDLGLPPKVEKTLYDGLALVLGFYPPIHADRLEEARRLEPMRFATLSAALWTLRLAPVLAAASGLVRLGGRVR